MTILLAVGRRKPDLSILDEYLPWSAPDGVSFVSTEDAEQRVIELPNVLSARGGETPANPHLRTYRFARECGVRKPAEIAASYNEEEAGLA